jgi:ABC-type oligopeptide transport system, periplasmic component
MKKHIRLISIITLVIISCTLLSSCNLFKKDTISVSLGQRPDELNPHYCSDISDISILNHIFEGLFYIDQNGNTQPRQAKDYTVTSDGLTYTITLRDDLYWSDGNKLTAQDYVNSWKIACQINAESTHSYMFSVIDGYDDNNLNIAATDETTLKVSLKEPCVSFLALLACPAYYPVRQDIIEQNANWAKAAGTLIGNGAYTIKEWSDSSLTVEKNKYYYGKDELTADSINFMFFDSEQGMNAYDSGQISFIDNLTSSQIEQNLSESDFNQTPLAGTYFIELNIDSEVISKVDVRQALALAIDRQTICDTYLNAIQRPADRLIAPPLSDKLAQAEYFDDFESSMQEAADLLEEAGHRNGRGLDTIRYIYYNEGGHGSIAESIAKTWETLGLTVELVPMGWNEFLSARNTGNYDVAHFAWFADYCDPMTFLELFRSQNANNDSQFASSIYDELLEQAEGETDEQKRAEYIAEAEQHLFTRWVLSPIYFSYGGYLQNENIEGVEVSALGYKFFGHANLI